MEDPRRVKMAKLRNALTRDIQIRKQRSENLMGSFRASNSSVRSTVQNDMIANRVKLGELKEHLRNLETDLFDALTVKTKQEVKHSATEQSISTANDRIQLLEKQIHDQRERRDEYASIISQQQLLLKAREERSEDDLLEMKNIDDLIMWYRRAFGLSIEGGEAGVKYTFSNINEKNLNDQYTFTVKLDGDTYSLVNCDPDVEDINTLMMDLNKTNDLFKFVRIMREKFKAAALKGIVPKSSAVVMKASTSYLSQTSDENKSEKPMKENVPQVQSRKELFASQISTPSPQSLSNRRRSPRIISTAMASVEDNKTSALPPCSEMIISAIEALNEKAGSNKTSNSKYIESKYAEHLPESHSSLLPAYLTSMKESGEILMVKNNYLKAGSDTHPPRGRGRPPKPKDPSSEVKSADPKPRGRPPKPKDGTEVTTESRGHGRPPKKAKVNGEDGTGPTSEATVKRGRGRPPKVKPPFADVGFA